MNIIFAFIAGFLTAILVVMIAYRRAENSAFRSFWGP